MAYKDPGDPRALAAKRKHYYKNKESYKQRAKANTEKAKQFLYQLKESNPCADCGKFYPYYVMDFDHRDPSTKFKGVSQLTSYGFKKMKEEISKCDLVCANCHRERTHGKAKG